MRDEGRKIKRGMIVHRPSSIVSLSRKAQTILEYTIVMGVIVVIMFAMGPMIRRGIQSLIKTVADEIGIQRNADQRFDDSGHLVSSGISTNATVDKVTSEGGTGTTVYSYNDTTGTISATVVDLGFTPPGN